jgi:hypothetical protein
LRAQIDEAPDGGSAGQDKIGMCRRREKGDTKRRGASEDRKVSEFQHTGTLPSFEVDTI